MAHEALAGKIYFNLGAAHADNPKGNLEKASENYLLACQCFEKVRDEEEGIRTQIRLGKVYLLQKDYENTDRILAHVRFFSESPRVLMHTDYLEAQLHLERKNLEAATVVAFAGLEKAQSLGAKRDEERFYELLKSSLKQVRLRSD